MLPDQLRRYSRNIILPEIGKEGQEKLLNSAVLVVGAGGLGSSALLHLAASGIGTIGIIDHDKVDLSNLQRQIIHEVNDIGRKKAESAKDAIHDLNPEIRINTYNLKLTNENAEEIAKKYDIIIDGSDNFPTRFLLNKICFELHKTLISAAIIGFTGQISSFKHYLGDPHPCYNCFCPEEPPANIMPNCSESGVFSPLAGIIGNMQTGEAIKELLNIGESLSGFIIQFDILKMEMRKIKLIKDMNCNLCQKK